MPGHQAMMNWLARGAGFRNLQHLRASNSAARRIAAAAVAQPCDMARVERALRCFDAQGRLTRWPAQTQVQRLCLWAMWARLPARQDQSEPQVNAILKAAHFFGDHALLRRSLIDHRLAERTRDGAVWRRIEQRPDAEALALLSRLRPI
ncbi:DUF2087 domain-containing protein [Paracoccus sp. p3-h83]|uniref:DUF2087 domain-containing protein n=1 Tax=Paracoccus sp. p3-h83 TaxID=3342805 RepID=UPI0035B8D85F